MTDHDVRQMLRRRAADVTPSPDAWAQIEARLTDDDGGGEGEGRVIPLATHSSRRRLPLLVAAALVVALGAAALVVARPDDAERVRTGPAAPSSTPSTAPSRAPVGAGGSVLLWPATTAAGLEALQREADTVGRPDLVDPRAAAGQYLSDRFLAVKEKRVVFEVGEYRAGDSQSGEVPYVADGLPGTVSVRRYGGQGSIWYVVSHTHLRLPVIRASYDGARFTAEVQPNTAGRLDVEVSGPNATESAGEAGREVRAGEVVTIDTPIRNAGVVIALFRFTSPDGVISLAEIGATSDVSRPPTTPGYCVVLESVMGERPESYVGSAEHLADIIRLRDAAPPQVAGDLQRYGDYVKANVDPAVPATQEPVNWPPDVRDALQRIDAHDARLCRGAP